VTVEADPSLVPILSQNLRDNGLDSRVHVVNTAIDYSGKSSTFFSVSESTLSGRVGEKGGIKIDTSTLASLLKRFSIEKFTLVSDIEGMEIPIFIEDVKSLKNCMQIFLEIDGYSYKGINYSVDDIICMVEKIGFSVVIRYHNCVVFEKL